MRPVQVLLIEDNEGDIFLIREALEESKINYEISVLRNGNEVLGFLKKDKEFANAKTPDLLLLDLNLPKKNGLEVLEEIKENDKFKVIPVIMFTTSSSENDVDEAYRRHVNCFITKPVNAQSFATIVNTIEDFWLRIATLPHVSYERK